jgi:hypothetical protein
MLYVTEEITMIEIINRELLIPPEEYNIGTNYDSNTEERHFHMKRIVSSGVDLASLDFHLDMQYTNGDKNSVTLTKDVTEKDINLTLPIVNSMLQVPGAVLIQLRALTEDGTCKWTSYQGALFVEESINTPAAWEGKLTELEQLENDIQRVEDDISGLNTDEAARKAAEEARVEAENAREAAEETRAATFTENEAARQATFESAETIRQNTYEADVAEFNEKQALLRGYAIEAESYAHGGTDSRTGEETDNARYYKEQSEIIKNQISQAAALFIPMFSVDWDPTSSTFGHLISNTEAQGIQFTLENGHLYGELLEG